MTDAEAADLYAGFAEPLLSFPALVALLLVAAFVGFHLGNAEYRRRGCDKVAAEQVPGGTSLGAMLALLGLQLGFAFSSALGWREARQSTLVDEAMAISTAFLTADLLEDPGRTELQTRILAYAQTRLASPGDTASREAWDTLLARTLEAQHGSGPPPCKRSTPSRRIPSAPPWPVA
jgi:hypothetical protein